MGPQHLNLGDLLKPSSIFWCYVNYHRVGDKTSNKVFTLLQSSHEQRGGHMAGGTPYAPGKREVLPTCVKAQMERCCPQLRGATCLQHLYYTISHTYCPLQCACAGKRDGSRGASRVPSADAICWQFREQRPYTLSAALVFGSPGCCVVCKTGSPKFHP